MVEKKIQEGAEAHVFAYDPQTRQIVGYYEFPTQEAAESKRI